MSALAVCGITFTLYPAFSTVGLIVVRSVAPTTRAIGPSLLIVCPRSFGIKIDAQGRAGGLEERAGRGDEPLRPFVAAEPGHGLGQLGDRVVLRSASSRGPALPRAVSRSQAMPFSAVCTR